MTFRAAEKIGPDYYGIPRRGRKRANSRALTLGELILLNILRTQDKIAHPDIDEIHRAIRLLNAPRPPIRKPRMGKLQEVAQRIAATQKRMNDEADKLASRLNEMDGKIPAAFERGHAIVNQGHADIDAMEAELRQLSNLPLGG